MPTPSRTIDPSEIETPSRTIDPSEIEGVAGDIAERTSGIAQPKNVIRHITQAAGRGGAQAVGAEVGGAIGALGGPAAPITVPLGAAAGAGIANVAAKRYLPSELGGDPDESDMSAFLWGALPEGMARGAGMWLASRAAARGAMDAHSKILEGLEAPKSAAEATEQIAQTLGRQTLRPSPVLTGEALTDATNNVREGVLGSINQQRRQLGEPIGEAYKALKGGDAIEPAEAADIADAARGVRNELISPAPQSQKFFARIKKWTGGVGPDAALEQKIIRDPDTGEITVRGELNDKDIESLKLQGFPKGSIDDLIAKGEEFKPPTLDQLRDLRQQVNGGLRSAKGGDAHALLNLQQALDEHLMPHLPPEINRDRELYRGFIQRFPWKDVNKINQMGTPSQISDYVFSGGPERAKEILGGMSAQDRPVVQQAFTDSILRKVDPNLPPEDQVKQIQKAFGPYMANGTVDQIYGQATNQELQKILYLPLHQVRMADVLKQPEQTKAFLDKWTETFKSGSVSDKEAAEAGMQAVWDSLPPAEQARFLKPPVPGQAMPVLPSTQQAIESGVTPAGKSSLERYSARRAQFAGPMSAGRAVTGSGAAGASYAAANALAFMSIALGGSGYRAIMNNGGASLYARLLTSPNGTAAARATMELLVGMGNEALRRQVTSPDEGTVPPP